MPNPITSKDLYQNTGEVDLLRAQLVGINEAIAAVLSNADNLQKIMRTLSGGKIGDQREIVKLAAELERLKKVKEELLQKEQRTQQEIYRTATAMNTEAASAQKTAIMHQKLKKSYNETQLSARRLEEQMKRTTNQTKRSSTSFTGLVGTLRTLAYTYFSLAAAQRVVGKFFEQTKAINTLDIAYQKVFGSTKRVSEAQGYLRDITERLGLDYLTTADAYLKFGAAAKQANIPVEQTNQIFESVSKAAAFLGLSTERVQLVFLALEQIISKGKLQTEELRRQLGEHLPGAFGIAAEAMGVTAGELTDLLKKGKIYSNEFLPKFAKQLEKAYGLENARRVDNLAAAQARFGNAFTDMVRKLDAASVFKDFFNTLTGILKVVSNNIGVFITLGRAVLKFVAAMVAFKLGVKIGAYFVKLLRFELVALEAIFYANPFGVFAAAVVVLLPLLTRMVDNMRGITKVSKEMKSVIDSATDSMADEYAAVQKNLDIITSLNSTNKERAKAYDALKEKYPGILNQYDLEKASLKDLKELNLQLKDAIFERVLADEKAAIAKELVKDLEAASKYVPSLFGVENKTIGEGRTLAVDERDIREARQKRMNDAFAEAEEKNKILEAALKTAKGFFDSYYSVQEVSDELSIDRKEKEAEIQKELNKLTKEQLLLIIEQNEAQGRSFGAADRWLRLRKKLAKETLDARFPVKTPGDGDGEGGDPDAEFKKEIARRKKLNDFLNEGRQKELEALRIRRDEELYFAKTDNELKLKIIDKFRRDEKAINKKYDLEKNEAIVSNLVDGREKELAELEIWFSRELDTYEANDIAILDLLKVKYRKQNEIEEKYRKEAKEKAEQARKEKLDKEEEGINTALEIFKLQSESLVLTSKQRDQLVLLGEIEALKRQRKAYLEYGYAVNSDQIRLVEEQIRAKQAAFREGEIEIGLDRASLELDANNASIDATVKNEDYKKKLKLKALIEYWESVLKLDTRLSDIEKGIIRDTIQSIRNEINDIGAGKRSLFDLLFANMDDRQREALKQSLEYALQYTTEYFNNIEALYDRAVETSQRFLDQKQKEYDDQLALQQAGHANNVEQAKKDLALAKQKNEQALKDQERFQKAQLVANTALEASNLAVGLSKIVKDLGPLAPFAIGAVLAAFIAAKITAFRAARKTFRKGGYEEIEGGSHESGRDTPVGTLSDGSVGYAEKGESVGIFTAKATRKYKPALKQLVDMANRGTLDRIMRQAEFANFPAIQAQMINTRGVEDRLDTLIEQGGDRSYLDSHGNTVIINRGRKTIIRK